MEINLERNVFIIYKKKFVFLNILKYFSFMYKNYNIYELFYLKVKIIMMLIGYFGIKYFV